MIDILTFIFGSFWRWLGTAILMLIIMSAVCDWFTVRIERKEDD